MTLKEAAENIATQKGKAHDVVFKENVKFSIRYWRALLIRRDVAANGVSDEYMQRLHLPLKKVDKADSCNFDLGACHIVVRTENQVPQTIRFKSDVPFKFLGDAYGRPFTHTQYEEVPYTCYNRFTPKVFRYAYLNGYVYVFNNTKIKYITIIDAFVDPYKANTLCGGVCFNDDSEFPCPADLMHNIITGIVTGEYRVVTADDSEVDIDKSDNTIK